jgi:hypothetical protein
MKPDQPTPTQTDDPVWAAAREYVARRSGAARPPGRYDVAGRFWLDEKCEGCEPVRRPSRAHPDSQKRHGRRAVHIARRYGVDRREVLAAARALVSGGQAGTDAALRSERACNAMI